MKETEVSKLGKDESFYFGAKSELPNLSFVIPIRTGSVPPKAVATIERIIYPKDRIEIILVEGRNPSMQRNEGVRRAKGDFIYLLDDDSEVSPKALRYAIEHFEESEDPRLVCIGGPVLTKPDDGPFQKAVGAAKASAFGMGPTRHRAVPYGLVRRASEKELISANMIIRREALLKLNGFDETIYPNEENELLKRLHFEGMRCLYHPLMVAYRSRRKNLGEVFIQNFRYGLGRMRHFFKKMRPVDLVLFAPLGLIASIALPIVHTRLYTALPIIFYAALSLMTSSFIALAMGNKIRTFFYLLTIFPTMHIAYGLGSLTGLIRMLLQIDPKPKKTEIDVRVVKELGT
jgi:succinoglycan biosynthesis protein ExoA